MPNLQAGLGGCRGGDPPAGNGGWPIGQTRSATEDAVMKLHQTVGGSQQDKSISFQLTRFSGCIAYLPARVWN